MSSTSDDNQIDLRNWLVSSIRQREHASLVVLGSGCSLVVASFLDAVACRAVVQHHVADESAAGAVRDWSNFTSFNSIKFIKNNMLGG
jgi:hypothetical protein